MFTFLAATFATLVPFAPVLAEGSKMKSSMAWGLVLLCVVLGMLVTVNPVKHDSEVKGRKE